MPPIYVMRHGQTVWNLEGRLQGSLDSPLTPLGRVQAARQGAILRRAGVIGRALVSPQGRARMTAALAGLDAVPDPRLAEIGMGLWQGRTHAQIDPPAEVAWRFDAPGGETRAALSRRVAALLPEIEGPTVLVTHGVTGIALRALLTGRGTRDWDAMEDPQGVVHLLQNGGDIVLR